MRGGIIIGCSCCLGGMLLQVSLLGCGLLQGLCGWGGDGELDASEDGLYC